MEVREQEFQRQFQELIGKCNTALLSDVGDVFRVDKSYKNENDLQQQLGIAEQRANNAEERLNVCLPHRWGSEYFQLCRLGPTTQFRRCHWRTSREDRWSGKTSRNPESSRNPSCSVSDTKTFTLNRWSMTSSRPLEWMITHLKPSFKVVGKRQRSSRTRIHPL